MNTPYITILAALAVLATAACGRDLRVDGPTADPHSDPIAFDLGGDFSAQVSTRASEVTTESIGTLYVSATSGTSSETAVFTSVPFTRSGSHWTGGKYWPASNPGYHFYLSNAALTHTAAGATVSPSDAGTDIVVDYLASPNYKQVNTATLEHIFAQVGTVSMKAPEGYAVTNMRVSLRPVTGGTYNLRSDSWTARSTALDPAYILGSASAGVTVSTEGGNATFTGPDNDLWLVPGSYVLTAVYDISKGAYSATGVTKTCTVTLVQGKNNNIGPTVSGGQDLPNIPEPSDIAEIAFTVTVTPWSDNRVIAEF